MLSETVEDLVAKHPIFGTDYTVTDEQRASLNQHGWTPVPNLLDAAAVEEIRSVLADVTRMDAGEASLVVKYSGAWEQEFMMGVATSRRFGSAVAGLTSEPVSVFAQDVSFFKEPGCPHIVFHQDHSHFPFDRRGCLSLWVALVDMTDDMGSLRYLEGSHVEGPLGFQSDSVGDPDIREQFPDLQQRRVVAGDAIKAGDARAHWDLTVHGSGPNEGTAPREAWVARYIRVDTIYNGVSHSHFDRFDLTRGDRFAKHPDFPLVGATGLVEKD
jgi:ectoine hydroxylase-related dioxygenase (phytanoyl-CoA dioxygenase family)